MRRCVLLLPLFLLTALVSRGQTARAATATVTGHVYCADTNAPARLATVILEPARLIDDRRENPKAFSGQTGVVSVKPVQTGLDGSFTIDKVTPGSYYVLAYKDGYVVPINALPPDAMTDSSLEHRKLIAKTVPHITVQAGLPASIDMRLERGAAVSGTLLFDDGSPASGLAVQVLVRRKSAKTTEWKALEGVPFGPESQSDSDDLGHYRLSGLPTGDYIVKADLVLSNAEFQFDQMGKAVSAMYRDGQTLSFYSGDTARQRNAAAFHVEAGDERTGEDITIPLSKLHTISGQLIAAHDGHVLNYGSVQLQDPDDKTELESAQVSRNDTMFHLVFVPEGAYMLHVSGAADVTWQAAPRPPGMIGSLEDQVHFQKSYGKTDQPLDVHDDMPSLVISVPDRSQEKTALGGH